MYRKQTKYKSTVEEIYLCTFALWIKHNINVRENVS
jgi:hypothetical protein